MDDVGIRTRRRGTARKRLLRGGEKNHLDYIGRGATGNDVRRRIQYFRAPSLHSVIHGHRAATVATE